MAVDVGYAGATAWEYAVVNDYDVVVRDELLPPHPEAEPGADTDARGHRLRCRTGWPVCAWAHRHDLRQARDCPQFG
ncbi:hypothetical protein A5759_06460 [Mycobacterium sp. 852014-52144_SCH5372336]|nr:hypothetical protein A5759_06460 [Mycobacterium sp. 852014-52144_SCH5372336]